ncbi:MULTISPECIES: hypothetical protein [Nocardia]|uniref:hypothetical protein n=1 Tax=Nocardia TaxID=1817 RepID=UPI0015628553|nr:MULTISPECIES: hypothetical protein [Nocardia]MBF6184660.1 hypothetical protein [Nocardia farcinica]MBF6310504.1 hypothetical protein [Nocardia farcinica]MBF6405677.1 hypothetical protein [Nocardia farcinica]MBF6522978.1 hypothetical protein [Nocardia farcinica]UEX24897.1 hypothetical protein LMJ57_10745 [Nocardia farcinica]
MSIAFVTVVPCSASQRSINLFKRDLNCADVIRLSFHLRQCRQTPDRPVLVPTCLPSLDVSGNLTETPDIRVEWTIVFFVTDTGVLEVAGKSL